MNRLWVHKKARCSSSDDLVKTKQGFTIIEVMLVLGITGLMLIGVIGGTYASIATQRYNDSVRSFSEFLRQVFAEVISPQSLGEGNSDAEAIYGKVVVFGLDNSAGDDIVYTATLVGGVNPPRSGSGFISELGNDSVKAHLFCEKTVAGVDLSDSVESYTPMWEAKIETPNDTGTSNVPMEGTLIIARSPASGTVHTAFTKSVYHINENCQAASNSLQQDLRENPASFDVTNDVDFCIVSYNSRVIRDIRLGADGHNSSDINLIPEDGDVKCHQK